MNFHTTRINIDSDILALRGRYASARSGSSSAPRPSCRHHFWNGLHPLLDALAALGLLPHWLQVSVPYIGTVIAYLILVVATRAWLELTLGKIRIFTQAAILLALAIALERTRDRPRDTDAPDQFVTAAYLFIDTQNYKARYSAAGHPPLLLSREGTLHRIESNGLVFGVTPQPDYPVRDISLCPGDRLLS